MRKITVDASKKYDILICPGLLENLGSELTKIVPDCKVMLVTDSRVDSLYSDLAVASLEKSGYRTQKYVFEEGEQSKNPVILFGLLEKLASYRFTRQDIIVALGGGVVGDLSGFAAAIYQRGIRFVQVPTTLLACVDSSVGGKTAVNLNAGKNLAGAFWQPEAVFCDTNLLSTLSRETFADGMAEVIKYGVIADRNLFDKVKNGNVENCIEDIIAGCVSIKRDIVNEDERENGIRKILNFGHTVGHAIEKCSNFRYSHGKAVAIGMVIAARACYNASLTSENLTDTIISALKNNNLPTECEFSAEELTDAALSDKKMSGDGIDFIVPEAIGKCSIRRIPADFLASFIEKGLE